MRRRISFGFTTVRRLFHSQDILGLYNVVPTERIMAHGLQRAGINAEAQYHVVSGKKRYCLDFAVFCPGGAIAIECDNAKAHAGRRQRERDKIKNAFLRRRRLVVVRLSDRDVISDLPGRVLKIKKVVRELRGLTRHGR